MYQEKRPTCVTVIGWAWIIIGSFMCFSAIMALFASAMLGQMSAEHSGGNQPMSRIFKFFPLLAIAQIGIAVLGIISGVNFLRLKAWARNALEVLTWILLLFIAGFMVFWVVNWLSMTSGGGPRGFSVIGAVMGAFVTGVYGVPLGIMLKVLRGEKVKTAIESNAEPEPAR